MEAAATYQHCCSGRHVWTRPEDAAKCCHPDWKRCLGVAPTPAPGVDAGYWHYWLHRSEWSDGK